MIVAHAQALQDDGLVFVVRVEAAPRELFGHDGIGQEADGDGVGDDADEHQRKDGVVVARDLEGEDDEGKRGARRRAEDRAHGHQRECARGEFRAGHQAVDAGRENAAQGRAGHEHRRQQAAGCARAERNHQRERLEDGDQQQELPGEAVVEDVGDGVVADAQHARHEVADDAEAERADRRMPQFVDRQTIELIFDPVEQFREADGRGAAQARRAAGNTAARRER